MRTKLKTIATAAILMCFSFISFTQQVAKTIPNSTSPDGLIGFLEFKPKDYGSQKHPLIIFLHGIGERGNGTSQINGVTANAIPYYCSKGASMRFTVGGQTSSFVVLSPQLSTQYGYWPTFYVKEMIKYAKTNLQVDPNRIYITGLSLGGGGTWRMITDSENFDYSFDAGIAAAAPVCGTQEENDANFCQTIGANHLPVWAFHSMDDGTVGVGTTQHAEILSKNCGVTPTMKFTYYQSGGHWGAWVNAYDTGHITTTVSGGGSFTANPNLYEWFLSNARSGAQTAGAPPPAAPPVATNKVPTANAGSNSAITLPVSSITLNGTASTDPDGSITSYYWTQTAGPAGAVINNKAAATTNVTGLTAGSYTFILEVTDNGGLKAYASVVITVNPAAPVTPPTPSTNQLPQAVAGVNQIITLPSNSTALDGTASKDPDGSIAGYHWTQTVGPAGAVMSNRDAATTSVTGLTAGTYTFILEVTDNGGLKAYAGVNITVNPAAPVTPPNPSTNQLPQAAAGANQTIVLPANSTTLDGSASKDPDGSIVAYRWTQTVGPAGAVMGNRDNVSTSITGLIAGSYIFILEVTDNGGLKAYSAVTLTVTAAPPATGGSTLLGYIKMSTGPYQACDDNSSTGRIPIYGTNIANGSYVYADAALTQKYNGGWNWFSFTPALGGPTTQAFAIYPIGTIGLLRSCAAGARIASVAAVAQDEATLKSTKDSAMGIVSIAAGKLSVYPNPVRTSATISLTSTENGMKTINVYNANGVLAATYNWQTTKGINTFSLKNAGSLVNGLYVVDIRNSNGVSYGTVKFLKM
jgi:predicted esterase